MRVRLDRYRSAHASMQWRSSLMIAFGAIAIVLGSFLALVGVLLFIDPDEPGLWPRRAGVVVGVFGGVFPLAAGVLLVWRGIVRRLRFGRIRDLAAFARVTPSFSAPDLSRALGVLPLDAERLVVDATSLGVLEDDAAAAIPFAPTVVAPAALPAPAYDPFLGAVLNGTYRIEHHLGAGGMGTVYAARHLRTGRRYAIKTLLDGARLDPDALKRFEREALAASALGHPNIVGVHDFHESESGVRYMVMDLLEGETLEQRLARTGSLPWPEARRMAIDLGSALVAAHEAGLLHRDLKPANVFLAKAPGEAEARAMLLDFGLVKPIDEAKASRITVTGAAVGTPMYMAPEQARGEALDVRTDVYGLAAVLFETVTGAPPFLDRTLASVYARLLTTAAPAASSLAPQPLPRELDALLAHALAKTPDERPPTMRAFVDALRAVHAAAA